MARAPDTSARTALVGRDRELQACYALLDRASSQGGALLLRGSAGVGKSVLLHAADAHAVGLRYQVLRGAASEAESSFAFAALQPLLLPVVDDLRDLPEHLRTPLRSALGLVTADIPTPESVALAVLGLLGDLASADRPVCVIVDDAQWLDASSAAVLRFVCRRITADPIVVLAAGRDGGWIPHDALPELPVEPLKLAEAEALLTSRASGLSGLARRRVLDQAEGNPLALVELSRALAASSINPLEALPQLLPLSARLEATFVQRSVELPEDSRMALLVAALAPTATVAEVVAAAAVAAGMPVALSALDAAELAALIVVDGRQIRFGHPLVRSGMIGSAPISHRRSAHAALAQVLTDVGRRLYHRAEASVGYDDELADELDKAAAVAVRRGSPASAIALTQQAAAATNPGPARGGRLLRAAQLSFELGRAEEARGLLALTAGVDLSRADHALARLLALSLDRPDADDPRPARELIRLAAEATTAGDNDGALHLLHFASSLMVWNASWAGVGDAILAATRKVPRPETDPLTTAIIAQTDPIQAHQELADRLSRLDDTTLVDAQSQQLIGFAAVITGDYERGAVLLDRAQQQLRAEARLAVLAAVLTYRAVVAFSSGQWRLALEELDEAESLADDSVQESWLNIVSYVRAGILGMLGDDDRHHQILDELAAVYERTHVKHRDNHLTFMRGMAAAMRNRHDEALALLSALFDPDEPMYEARTCYDALFYLAGAAAAKDRPDLVHRAIASLATTVPQPFPAALQSAVDYARAVTEGDRDAQEQLFARAMTGPANRRPFDRARVQLAYGEWLRRQNRRLEARESLRAARITFDRLGNEPFAQRARDELRAAGEASGRNSSVDWDQLSPQEMQIARLVAEGLSNRQIGEQLFLSHRTISSHLYRMFPKLGITSRAQLASAIRERVRDLD